MKNKTDLSRKWKDLPAPNQAGLAVIGVVVLTLLAIAESTITPWAPYFVAFPIIAIALPIYLKAYTFGSIREAVFKNIWFITLVLFGFLFWEYFLGDWLYQKILSQYGLQNNPDFSVDRAFDLLSQTAANKFGFNKKLSEWIFAFYAMVWAPCGEELLYWGFLFRAIRRVKRFWATAFITGIFFGLRHAVHFTFLWPHFPVVSAAVFAFTMLGSGILNSYLFEKTQSLYPLILLHILDNVFWFAVSN